MDAKCRLVEEARSEVGELLYSPCLHHVYAYSVDIMVADHYCKLGRMASLIVLHRRCPVGVYVGTLGEGFVQVIG